jgi:hypothetical protein
MTKCGAFVLQAQHDKTTACQKRRVEQVHNNLIVKQYPA